MKKVTTLLVCGHKIKWNNLSDAIPKILNCRKCGCSRPVKEHSVSTTHNRL